MKPIEDTRAELAARHKELDAIREQQTELHGQLALRVAEGDTEAIADLTNAVAAIGQAKAEQAAIGAAMLELEKREAREDAAKQVAVVNKAVEDVKQFVPALEQADAEFLIQCRTLADCIVALYRAADKVERAAPRANAFSWDDDPPARYNEWSVHARDRVKALLSRLAEHEDLRKFLANETSVIHERIVKHTQTRAARSIKRVERELRDALARISPTVPR